MEYEVIATVGPASEKEETWLGMLSAGATGFRLNTSHLSPVQVDVWMERMGRFLAQLDKRVFLTLDLQGSKWRLGQFPAFELPKGERVQLVFGESTDKPGCLPVPHRDFFKAAESSDGEIVLNDGRSNLQVGSVREDQIDAIVVNGGVISARKGITLQHHGIRVESLGEKDRYIFDQTHSLAYIRYAISYVKDGGEMEQYRAALGKETHLTAKLERQIAMEEAQMIAKYSEDLWVCRGDLGAEMGSRGMAEAVAAINGKIGKINIPVYMAGQVLEHMTAHNSPTRSEICYLFDTLNRGYKGIILSDETATGGNPIEACKTAAIFKGGLKTNGNE